MCVCVHTHFIVSYIVIQYSIFKMIEKTSDKLTIYLHRKCIPFKFSCVYQNVYPTHSCTLALIKCKFSLH